jgi:hypothetical protein
MSKSNQKYRGIFSPMSEFEGQVVACETHFGDKLFVIEEGRRCWVEEPPKDVLEDLLPYALLRGVKAVDRGSQVGSP